MSTDQPPLCYVIVPGAAPGKRIGIVKRGEKGYYKAGVDNGRMPARALVDHLNEKSNEKLGVSAEEADRCGSARFSVGMFPAQRSRHEPGHLAEAHSKIN